MGSLNYRHMHSLTDPVTLTINLTDLCFVFEPIMEFIKCSRCLCGIS